MFEHCGVSFKPAKSHILNCEPMRKTQYKYQKLLVGKCPECQAEVMAWIGIDYFMQEAQQFRINPAKHDHWMDRLLTCLVSDYHAKGHNFVNGSVYDHNSGKYLYHPRIRVA